MGNVVTKSWGAMEEVLYKQTKSFDKWIFWRTFYICAILDIFIWYGTCLLIQRICRFKNLYFLTK